MRRPPAAPSVSLGSKGGEAHADLLGCAGGLWVAPLVLGALHPAAQGAKQHARPKTPLWSPHDCLKLNGLPLLPLLLCCRATSATSLEASSRHEPRKST